MTVSRRAFIKQGTAVGVTVGLGGYLAGVGRSRPENTEHPLRPPGSLKEHEFVATCIRCMRCVDACPNHALTPLPENSPAGTGGTPMMEPRKAACMLCANEDGEFLKCTEACPSGALQLIKKEREDITEKVAIGIAEIDFNLCYSYNNWSCGACFRACPLGGEAMTVGRWEQPTVHADACVGCGCCERACIRYPHAIRVKTREA
ncbi:MAG: 4Fe-4S dicluster domain-containing protein [Phycisphaerales bacterium]|nr:4Fe-4S dicluster domain-containing protein [Phycisphaerales bacterium]